MTENKNDTLHTLGSNLAVMDAHTIQPHEYEELPEWTEEMFATAKVYHGGQLVKHKNNDTLPTLGSNLAMIDAHVITDEEYAEIPELDDEWFATADVYHAGQLVRRGRPRGTAKKTAIKLRCDTDVSEAFRATGKGWQTRMNEVLRQHIHQHPTSV
jgi:uncharacterized protein (DUF4415 family)